MAYAIFMLDKPGSRAVRDAHRAAHYEYLKSFETWLVVSGGLLEDDESAFKGGLIVIDVDTRAQAEEFVAGDPFTKAGLQETTRIERLRVAFFGGRRV